MKKNKNITRSTNGILVCDSIVMSVKKKRLNTRRIEAVFIGLAGYISTIMAFLGMFSFNYSKKALIIAAVVFSALYITLSLIGRKAMLIVTATAVGAMVVAYKYIDSIALGYKFVYNVIYRASYRSEIIYYKFLNFDQERRSITIFFIFCAWLMAIIIYLFTIYHPNAILPLLVTFPMLEVGLYNGIKVSIFWGMLLVGYWLALFAMTAIDMGEYSGGSAGFVRKENLFFPKRQMRLKVTEKCGIYIILGVMTVSGITAAIIRATGYERSDKLNQKRIDIRDAISSFSIENFSESVSNITSAFGLTLKVQTHKLGNVDRLRYKDRTDLIVTLDRDCNGAIYLKEYTGTVYKNNEWSQLSDSAYRSDIFNDFKNYSIYPQDFPAQLNELIRNNDFDLSLSSDSGDYMLWIKSKLKGNRSFSPYSTEINAAFDYDNDLSVSSKIRNNNNYSYQFSKMDMSKLTEHLGTNSRYAYSMSGITSNGDRRQALLDYCADKNLNDSYIPVDTELMGDAQNINDNADIVLAQLLEKDYRQFVYDNYLQLPESTSLDEVRQAYSDILDEAEYADTAQEKLELLSALRERIASETEYTLSPGRTPNNRDFVNYFLLENKKGYCTHFATSGVILARMAGIPARYATGYVIVADDFTDDTYMKNPNTNDSSYGFTINVKDNRSHAWSEVYLNGYGWIPFEFTAGYTDSSIETDAAVTTEPPPETTVTTAAPENTETRPSTTRDNSSTHTTAASTAASTSVSPLTSGDISGAWSGNGGGAVSRTLRVMIHMILLIAAAAAIVYVRRMIILRIRLKRFTVGNARQRMGHMYSYAERLLKLCKVTREDKGYTDFAKLVERSCGGIFFTADAFNSFVDAGLRASFSNAPPSAEELAQCRRFTVQLSESIYKRAGKARKFYLKYIAVLIK